MKTFAITFEIKEFYWKEPYRTTYKIEAKDRWEACEIAEEIAERNTRNFRHPEQSARMTIVSVC